jgi:phosphate/sulfate permease
MQAATACYMSFAHGANDCANAIGPLAAAIQIFRNPSVVPEQIAIPAWLLAFGAAGIVLGVSTYGYKVIKTIGKNITEITPTRGFSAEFGTATSVLVFSKLGMPISTTFVIVGAVMGVGLARGFAALDIGVIRRIFTSWVITIPVSAGLSMVVYWILMATVG